MPNISSIIKNVRNIMRQDRGVSGDAQRLEQLGWMLFLKILDDKDQELELIRDGYTSVIPEKFQWRNWATNPEGITGDELHLFIDHPTDGLFAQLRALKAPHAPQRAALVREVFDGSNNYMKSGFEMRKVINQLNGFDFNNSDDRHIFGTVYESILVELRDAGNKGEYYTPRAITRLMTQMTDPRLGQKVLDPAAGTGGFLSAAIDYIREKEVRTLDDEAILQKSITGWELKPVSYVLGLTNLILHGLDVPDWHYIDSLKTDYKSIGPKQQVEVILANPPFGASIADGVATNFPAAYRCSESADLFLVLMIQLLKPGGRCAIVLPDGCITGDGYKERIREKLLTDCNLHTIVRLPQSTFHPATVSTNLLFFEKGTPTKEIWYYEHRLPEGQKSYSKTKAIQFEEFAPMIEWWRQREENEVAWKVKAEDLKRGFDLDVKNPHAPATMSACAVEATTSFETSISKVTSQCDALADVLQPLGSKFRSIARNPSALFLQPKDVSAIRTHILGFAIDGRLTVKWRAEHPEVEPARQLLQRIQAEKARLIAAKIIRPEKPLPKITPDEIPFEIPNGWEWCRLLTLCEKTGSGSTPAGGKTAYSAAGIPFLRSQNVHDDGLHLEDVAFVSHKIHSRMEGTIVYPHDVLLNITGGSIGRCAVVGDEIEEANVNQHVAIVRPVLRSMTKFVHAVIRSPYFQQKIEEAQTGAGREGLPKNKMDLFLIPLPPLAEQAAIVERVEGLMATCRALEAEIEHARTHAAHLLQAVLKEAFTPAAA